MRGRQTSLCDTARTAGICSARLYPISSTISMLQHSITIPGHHRQVRRRHPQTVRLQGSSGVLAHQLQCAWLKATIRFCSFMLRTRGAPTTASPGIRMYAAGFVAASAKKAFVSGLLVTWAGVRPALSLALMSAPCVRVRRGVSRSSGHRRSKRRLKMQESECFLEQEGKQRARAKGERIRRTNLAHQEAADLGVVISRSHMKRRAVFLQTSASIQHNYSIADLFPGPFALPAPESRREQDLHTEQAECKGANWGSKAPARPLLRALWRVQWCTSRINSTRRKGCLTSSGAFTLMPIFTASMMSFGSPRQHAKCSSVFLPAVVMAV